MTRPFTLLVTAALMAVSTAADAQKAREVSYTPQSVVQLRAKLRFTTMIILPEQEEILDFVCGDKEFWIVSGVQNLAYIKPAKAGVTTNLNLVTASGRVYSFVLTEGAVEPDLKVFVTVDDALKPPSGNSQRFYSAVQVEEARRDAEDARREADEARTQADAARAAAAETVDERIKQFRATYPTQLRFPYRYDANRRPFNVSAIYTDGTFTYIHAAPAELPALYELVDNASHRTKTPNLVNFQVEHGIYVVPKVLDRGYLAIGKQQLVFEAAR